MSEALRQAILQRATVRGEIVMVDGFLNHRVETELIADIGRFLASAFETPDAVVTSEASGIAPAYAVATEFGVPMVFAKKRPSRPDDAHTRQVLSPTKGDHPWLSISQTAMAGLDRVLIIDDFLWGGRTALALVEMLAEAEVNIVGAGFCVEKTFGDGRRLLEEAGVKVVAAAVVTGIENGRPVLAD